MVLFAPVSALYAPLSTQLVVTPLTLSSLATQMLRSAALLLSLTAAHAACPPLFKCFDNGGAAQFVEAVSGGAAGQKLALECSPACTIKSQRMVIPASVDVAMTNVLMTDMTTTQKGGLVDVEGALSVHNCSFTDGNANNPPPGMGGAWGGCVYVGYGGSFVGSDVLFQRCNAEDGNGVNSNGLLNLTSATFADNGGLHEGANGGGLWSGGTMSCTDCVFRNNSAWEGGGFFAYAGVPDPQAKYKFRNSLTRPVYDSNVAGNKDEASNGCFCHENPSSQGQTCDGCKCSQTPTGTYFCDNDENGIEKNASL